MTEARGKKVTDAVAHMPRWRRTRVSELLIEAFLAVPLFSSEKDAMFHADPHAGNLLYDKRTGDLTILDWALTEHVNREERRHLAMLFFMTALRDPDGIVNQIQALSRGGARRKGSQAKIIRDCVDRFIAQLPLTHIPGAADALDMLEDIAFKGVRLPAPLIMLRKVLFTLDGVQHDMGDPEVSMVAILARHATPVSYLCDGQGVPQDLSEATVIRLLMNMEGFRIDRAALEERFSRASTEEGPEGRPLRAAAARAAREVAAPAARTPRPGTAGVSPSVTARMPPSVAAERGRGS